MRAIGARESLIRDRDGAFHEILHNRDLELSKSFLIQ